MLLIRPIVVSFRRAKTPFIASASRSKFTNLFTQLIPANIPLILTTPLTTRFCNKLRQCHATDARLRNPTLCAPVVSAAFAMTLPLCTGQEEVYLNNLLTTSSCIKPPYVVMVICDKETITLDTKLRPRWNLVSEKGFKTP